jgi:hypothetical protein
MNAQRGEQTEPTGSGRPNVSAARRLFRCAVRCVRVGAGLACLSALSGCASLPVDSVDDLRNGGRNLAEGRAIMMVRDAEGVHHRIASVPQDAHKTNTRLEPLPVVTPVRQERRAEEPSSAAPRPPPDLARTGLRLAQLPHLAGSHEKEAELNRIHFQNMAAVAALKYADTCWHSGAMDEARAFYETEWQAYRTRTEDDNRALTQALAVLCAAYSVTGLYDLKNGLTTPARQQLRRSRTLGPYYDAWLDEQAGSASAPPRDRAGLATAWAASQTRDMVSLAVGHMLDGQSEAVAELLQEAEAIAQQAFGANVMARPADQPFVAPTAVREIGRAMAALAEAPPETPPAERAVRLHTLGRALAQVPFDEAAYACFMKSLALFKEAGAPETAPHGRPYFFLLPDLAATARRLNEHGAVTTHLFAAAALGEKLLRENPQDEAVEAALANCRSQIRRRLQAF